jgi:DNA repair protein RadC
VTLRANAWQSHWQPDIPSGPVGDVAPPAIVNQSSFDFVVGETANPADNVLDRLDQVGPRALSDTEILTVLLQSGGVATTTAPAIARAVLAEAGSIAKLLDWSPAEFRRIPGIGRTRAAQLAAAAELGRRAFAVSPRSAPQISSPAKAFEFLRPIVAGLTVEKIFVLALNRKERLLKTIEITSGTATAALGHPREVLRAVLLSHGSVSAFMLAHNHPSGDPAPSSADIHFTRTMREAAKSVDLQLLDHVIVGTPGNDPLGRGFYSFRESGII